MKKQLLVGLSLLTGGASFAQITINANDIIGFGEFVELTTDTIPTIIHTANGPDQTWNYTSLNSHVVSEFGFGAPSWYDGDLEFPNATLAWFDIETNTTAFFNKSIDALDVLGIYGDFLETGTPQALKFDQFDRQVSFPSTYQTEFFNTYTFGFTLDGAAFSLDSVVIDGTSDKTSLVDAWGTLTTPFGTFDVIRQAVYEATTTVVDGYLFGASVFNDTQVEETYTYTFWTNDAGSRYAVLEYTYDPAISAITEVTWQSGAPTLSIQEAGEIANIVNVFPNPANDQLTIEVAEGNYEVAIIDAIGREVSTLHIDSSNNRIATTNLSNGVYSLRISSESGVVDVQRFVVQH